MHCHGPEHMLSMSGVLLLGNVTFTSVRNSISEGMSLLTFTRCLQKDWAARGVSELPLESYHSTSEEM